MMFRANPKLLMGKGVSVGFVIHICSYILYDLNRLYSSECCLHGKDVLLHHWYQNVALCTISAMTA